MAKIHLFILLLFALLHEINCSQCLCLYATACKSNADCCAGLYCNIRDSIGASQCLEDISTSNNPNCISTNDFGCLTNADCCNQAAKCGSQYFGTCNLASNCTYIYSPTSQPSSRPTSIPTSTPSRSPTRQPSAKPTAPTSQPSKQPSKKPSRQPSSAPSKPSIQPSRQPSVQPVHHPSRQPRTRPTSRPSMQPTRQPFHSPSMQPKVFPTLQPVRNPSHQPSCQPFWKPTLQPSHQPAMRPSSQPLEKPSAVPSQQPSYMPTKQPIQSPSIDPSGQPSFSPVTFPTKQPNRNPSYQPTSNPSVIPSSIPSFSPSSVPSAQPTLQPTCYPSGEPTIQPLNEPSKNPFGKPTIIPSIQPQQKPTLKPGVRPSNNPSTCPSLSPSKIPFQNPTAYPSNQPSNYPSVQPTNKPAVLPTVFPSRRPTIAPSVLPSVIPTKQPICFPSSDPSIQPVSRPSYRPTELPSCMPSRQPTSQPYSQPSQQPTEIPSLQPFHNPTRDPSGVPSMQPTNTPTNVPSVWPTSQPILKPTGHPISSPSTVPSNIPSYGPSARPSDLPISYPSCHPSNQPKCSPTRSPQGQPSFIPTSVPISSPTNQPHKYPSSCPSSQPRKAPTKQPYSDPTAQPREIPTSSPSTIPSELPSHHPSDQPTTNPSEAPSKQPAVFPTQVPILNPSSKPSCAPLGQPSATPSGQPLGFPSACPSVQITNQPSHKPILQPSSCPTEQPKHRPTKVPSKMPSSQPRINPTTCPSAQPTFYPSVQPVSFKALFLVVNIPSSYLNASYLDAFKVAVSSAIGIRVVDISVLPSLDPPNRRKLLELYHIEVLTEFNVPWDEFTVFQYNVTFLHGYLYHRIVTNVYNGNMTTLFQKRLKSLGVDVSGNPRIISVDGGQTSNTSPQSRSIWSAGLIAGVTIGSACLIAGVFVTAMLYRKYSKEKKKKTIETGGLVKDKVAEPTKTTSSGDYFTLDIYPQSRDNFNLQNEGWIEATGRLMKTFSSRSMDFAGAYEQTLTGAAAPDAVVSGSHDSFPSPCAPDTEQSVQDMLEIDALTSSKSLSQSSDEVAQSAQESAVKLEDQEDEEGSINGDEFKSESLPQSPLGLLSSNTSPTSLNLLAQRNKRNHHVLRSHSQDENIIPEISLSKSHSRSFGSKSSESTCLIYEDIYPENADPNISCTVSPRERILKQRVLDSQGSDRLLSKFPLIMSGSDLGSSGSNDSNGADDERHWEGDDYSSGSRSYIDLQSFRLTRKLAQAKKSSNSDDDEGNEKNAADADRSRIDIAKPAERRVGVAQGIAADPSTLFEKVDTENVECNSKVSSLLNDGIFNSFGDSDSLKSIMQTNVVTEEVSSISKENNSGSLHDSTLSGSAAANSIDVLIRSTDNVSGVVTSPNSFRLDLSADVQDRKLTQVISRTESDGNLTASAVSLEDGHFAANKIETEDEREKCGSQDAERADMRSSANSTVDDSNSTHGISQLESEVVEISSSAQLLSANGNPKSERNSSITAANQDQDLPTIEAIEVPIKDFSDRSASSDPAPNKLLSNSLSKDEHSAGLHSGDFKSHSSLNDDDLKSSSTNISDLTDSIDDSVGDNQRKVISAVPSAEVASRSADSIIETSLVECVVQEKLSRDNCRSFSAESIAPTVDSAVIVDGSACTVLASPCDVGDQKLIVASQDGFVLGMTVVIAMNTDNEEYFLLTGFGSLLLDSVVLHSHPVGTVVRGFFSGIGMESDYPIIDSNCDAIGEKGSHNNVDIQSDKGDSVGQSSSVDQFWSKEPSLKVEYCSMDTFERPQNNIQRPPLYISSFGKISSSFDTSGSLRSQKDADERADSKPLDNAAAELYSLYNEQSCQSDNTKLPESELNSRENEKQNVCDDVILKSSDGDKSQSYDSLENSTILHGTNPVAEPQFEMSEETVTGSVNQKGSSDSEIGSTFIEAQVPSHNIKRDEAEPQLQKRRTRNSVDQVNLLSDATLRSTSHNWLPSDRDFPTLGDLTPQNNNSSPRKSHQKPSHQNQSDDIFRAIESPEVVRSLTELPAAAAPSTDMPYLLSTSSMELQEFGRHRIGFDEKIYTASGEQTSRILEAPSGELRYLKKESISDFSPSLYRPVVKTSVCDLNDVDTSVPMSQQDDLAPRNCAPVDLELHSNLSSDVNPRKVLVRNRGELVDIAPSLVIARDKHSKAESDSLLGLSSNEFFGRRNNDVVAVTIPEDSFHARSTPLSMSLQNASSFDSMGSLRKETRKQSIPADGLHLLPSTSLGWSPSDRDVTSRGVPPPRYNDSSPRMPPSKSSQRNEAEGNLEYSLKRIGSSEKFRPLVELLDLAEPLTSSPYLLPTTSAELREAGHHVRGPKGCEEENLLEDESEMAVDSSSTLSRPVVKNYVLNSPFDRRTSLSENDDLLSRNSPLRGGELASVQSLGDSTRKIGGRNGIELSATNPVFSTPRSSHHRAAESNTQLEGSQIPISIRREILSSTVTIPEDSFHARSTPLSMSLQNASSFDSMGSLRKETRKQSIPADGLHLLPSTSLGWSPSDRDVTSRGVPPPRYNDSSPRMPPSKSSRGNEAEGNSLRSIGSTEKVRSLVGLSEFAAPSTSTPLLLPTSSAELREAGRYHFAYKDQCDDRKPSELKKEVLASLIMPQQDFSTRGNSVYNLQDFSSPNNLRNSSSIDRSQSQGRSFKEARLYHESSGKDRVGRSPKEDERIKRRSSDSQMSTPLVSLPNSSKKRSSSVGKRYVTLECESYDSASSDSTLDLQSLRELRDLRSGAAKIEHHDERDFLKFYEEMQFDNNSNTDRPFPAVRQSSSAGGEALHNDSRTSNFGSNPNPFASSSRRVGSSTSTEIDKGEVTIKGSSVILKPSKVDKANFESNELQNAVVANAKSTLKSTKILQRSETFDQIPQLKDGISRLKTPLQLAEVPQQENPETQEELLEPKDRFRKTLDKFKRNITTKALKSKPMEVEINSTSADNVEMRCLTTPRKLRPVQSMNMEYIRASTSATIRSSSAFVKRISDFNSLSMDNNSPRPAAVSVDEWEISPEVPLSVKFKEAQKKFEVLIKRNSNLPFSKDPTPSRSLRASWRINVSADQEIATTALPSTIPRPVRRLETKSAEVASAPQTSDSQQSHFRDEIIFQRGNKNFDNTNSITTSTVEPSIISGRDIQKRIVAPASVSGPEVNNTDRRRPSNRLALEMMEKYKEQRDVTVIRPGHVHTLSNAEDSLPVESMEANNATELEASPSASHMSRSQSWSPNSVGKINLSLKERAKAALNLKLLQMSHKLVSQMEGEDAEDGSSISSSVDSAVLEAYFDGEKNKKLNQMTSSSETSRSIGIPASATSSNYNPHETQILSRVRASTQASPTRVQRPRQENSRVRNATSPTTTPRAMPRSNSGRSPTKRWNN